MDQIWLQSIEDWTLALIYQTVDKKQFSEFKPGVLSFKSILYHILFVVERLGKYIDRFQCFLHQGFLITKTTNGNLKQQ